MNLLLEIARCPNVVRFYQDGSARNRCCEIISCQERGSIHDHQVPEPWSGRLATAPILFLSSNPSISQQEDYPRPGWSDHLMEDFFNNRFGGGIKPWVVDSRHLCKGGGRGERKTRFWVEVQSRASELLGKRATPGLDYAISEIVHCKSKKQLGVAECLEECSGRYLDRLLSDSGAQVVVILGAHAEEVIRDRFRLNHRDGVVGPLEVGAGSKYLTFLPHPNARKKRKFVSNLTPEEISLLRGVLGVPDATQV